MKYTNIKKLLIKFMGGGLINFPTRFLRWIKIDGDAEGDDGGGESSDSESLLMSLISNNYPKPTLFLYKRDENDNNPIDVTNYKIDDLINLVQQEESDLYILCLYESSNLNAGIASNVLFNLSEDSTLIVDYIYNNIGVNEISYNNKNYYFYQQIAM